MSVKHTVLVTGGAGYVGSVLVPKLLAEGHSVRVLDTYYFGDSVLSAVRGHPGLTEIQADMRDRAVLDRSLKGCTAVIHLACISNDPSFELDPSLGKSINYDAFFPLVELSKKHSVGRFIYASSSSVYGIKDEDNVTEELSLQPLTDYSKYKAMCEDVLMEAREPGCTVLTLRPATVCGYSPRLRLDLSVNILTNLAVNNGRITVFGGEQLRPNLHVEDMTDLYLRLLAASDLEVDNKIWNAGRDNLKVRRIEEMVRERVGDNVEIVVTPTDDHRSYHVSSEKLHRELGFSAQRTVSDAIEDLKQAFAAGKIPDSMQDDRYYNIKRMRAVLLR